MWAPQPVFRFDCQVQPLPFQLREPGSKAFRLHTRVPTAHVRRSLSFLIGPAVEEGAKIL